MISRREGSNLPAGRQASNLRFIRRGGLYQMSRREESNLQPTVYDTVALPLSYFGAKRDTGIEPAPHPWEGHVLPLY